MTPINRTRVHLVGCSGVTLIVGGTALGTAAGLALGCIGVAIMAILVSWLLKEADVPGVLMRPGVPMRVFHLVTGIGHLLGIDKENDPKALPSPAATLEFPVYLRWGTRFVPAGMVFAATLDGTRVLVIDRADEPQEERTDAAESTAVSAH